MRGTLIVLVAAVFTLAGLFLWAGCSDDNSPVGNGYIRMHLVDDPATQFDHVYIDITHVEVHQAEADSNSGWITVRSNPGMYDLLALTNGIDSVLADTELAPGHYTQIRLFLSDNNTVVIAGQSFPLEIPSSQTTGLKLNTPFDIVPKTLYEVTLDFNAEDEIHQNGNGQWIMNPVIRVQANAVSGSISGTVSPAAALPRVWTIVGADTVSTLANSLSGYFKLVAVPIGTYTVHIDPTAGSWLDTTVAPVQVTALQNTDLGTITLQP